MRIGIDARILSTSRALSRYTKNIIENLLNLGKEHEWTLLTDDPKQLSQLQITNYKLQIVPKKCVLRDHFLMQRTIKKLNLDLFFHPDNTEFLFCHPRSVVTLHDVMPWKFPELIFSKNPLMNLRQRLYFRLQTWALKKSATKILTVSENTKKDIVEILGIEPEKVVVTYEGVEKKFKIQNAKIKIEEVKKKYGIAGEYIFYVGGMEPHKNVGRLIEAFANLITPSPSHLTIQLVIGGKKVGEYAKLSELVERLGIYERVVFTGFIDERDLPYLYRGAKIFVYPSLYEGFGFPPLEAMASGTPLVVSKAASLPEVVGDAGILVNPESVDEIKDGISKILHCDTLEYDTWVKKGIERAEKFNWGRCARETLRVFEGIARIK